LASRCCRTVDTEAIEQLDKAGQLRPVIPPVSRSATSRTLVLGTMLFESGNFERARQSLTASISRTVLEQALLRAGGPRPRPSSMNRALVPWNILVDREQTDCPVQEVMLAVPHAYASLNYGRAASCTGAR